MAVMRRLVPSVVLVLMLASLVACTRPDARILALAVRDGRPTGVLVTCNAAASQLQVVQTDNKGEPPVSGKPMIRWAVRGTPATEVIEVPLLSSPLPGWVVDDATGVPDPNGRVTVKIEALTGFKPGLWYRLGGSSPRVALPVDFTTADFTRIGTDDVLAPARGDAMTVTSLDDFVRAARIAACD
jgi:hypothetical protein